MAMAFRTVLRSLPRWHNFTSSYSFPVVMKQQKREKHDNRSKSQFSNGKLNTLAGFLFGTAFITLKLNDDRKGSEKMFEWHETVKAGAFVAGQKRPDLPYFTAEDVSKHDTKESFWVIYKNGVYDVTSFLLSHPGGDQIMMAGGLSIEPFWNFYGTHKTQDVYKLLETYRIGNLCENDVSQWNNEDEIWSYQPARCNQLIVKSAKPFNAETPPQVQVDHFETPNELFYVREHLPVPKLDACSHKFSIVIKCGCATKISDFTLKDLESLFCSVSDTLQLKPVNGIKFGIGAISNACWRGVYLRELLLQCGLDENTDTEGKHVIFEGADIDATGTNFSTSIPLHKALNPSSKIMLVTEMNGADLLPDHGYPLRVLVPGAPGFRSVKWLQKITVSSEESPCHWHKEAYRFFNPTDTWETVGFGPALSVYSLPVTSAICDPLDGDSVQVVDGHITVRGYAYSGGGAKILRVDVTANCGGTWMQAKTIAQDNAPPTEHYAWTLWEARVPVKKGQRELELWVKATDSNFNTQPELFNDIWNIRGVLCNAYHRIKVQLKPSPPC